MTNITFSPHTLATIRLIVYTLLLFALSAVTGFAQVDIKTLSPKKMEKDVADLIEIIDAHPDPYSKIEQEDFDQMVNELKEKITVEMDEFEFYKEVSAIVASIRDGHSRVMPPFEQLARTYKTDGVFPYRVFLTNENKLFVIEAYDNTQIPLGSEILEINGMKIETLIENISPYISYETIPFRNTIISQSFELYLYMQFKKTVGFPISYEHQGNKEVIVTGTPFKIFKELKKDRKDERDSKLARGEPYEYTTIRPGVGKIDIFSFAVEDFDKYDYFLNKTFKTIRKEEIHSLIIDVRGNFGGYPKVASRLFHHIHEGHFKTLAKSKMKISRAYREYFTKRIPALRNQHYVFPKREHSVDLQKILQDELGTYSEDDVYFNEDPNTENFEFSGDCYLLTDRNSYSASSAFASTFQCYNMGTIIGETTGGTKIFRANPFYEKLTHSGIGVSMATTLLYNTCFTEIEEEGVAPNVEVTPTILDHIHKSDPQLNMALMLIRKVQNEKAAADDSGKN